MLQLGSGWEYPEDFDEFDEPIGKHSIARSRRQSMSAFSKSASRHNQYTNNQMQPYPEITETSSDNEHQSHK